MKQNKIGATLQVAKVRPVLVKEHQQLRLWNSAHHDCFSSLMLEADLKLIRVGFFFPYRKSKLISSRVKRKKKTKKQTKRKGFK